MKHAGTKRAAYSHLPPRETTPPTLGQTRSSLNGGSVLSVVVVVVVVVAVVRLSKLEMTLTLVTILCERLGGAFAKEAASAREGRVCAFAQVCAARSTHSARSAVRLAPTAVATGFLPEEDCLRARFCGRGKGSAE